MDDERWQRAKVIFNQALAKSGDSQSVFLNEACRNDLALRREVESLLSAYREADQFIESPVVDDVLKLIDRRPAELSGKRIGHYEIIRKIGDGGMGAVYLAARADDQYQKQVAIKLVKFGFDDEFIVNRFLSERQILATLDHPNIARLIDGGTTENGSPYLVMEYIEGVPIDSYCETKGSSLAERLQLFRTVCGAVQYAHNNLVIHRDIKPSNILVTNDGTPKLLDFGIAKLLSPNLSAPSQAKTATAVTLMTPDYASPEQVLGHTVTTATDVYSLGVVLYELLIGQRPYQVSSNNPQEMIRAICDEEPKKPSSAISNGGLRNSDSRSRPKVEPRNNPKSLRGDIDNIVLMALRKESSRRYKSVEQFSEDITRHLEGLPVVAHQDTFAYRASKFIGRNRIAVTAAALVVLVIISGLGFSLWQSRVARRQRDVAESERAKAELINRFLQQMLSFSNQSFSSVSPVAQSKDVTVNQMLEQITPYIESELANQPDVRAQVLRTIGSAYASQGNYELAEKNFRKALEAKNSISSEIDKEAAATMTELGVLLFRRNKLQEAHELLERAVTFYRKQRQSDPAAFSATKLALALDYWGVTKAYLGDSKGAMALSDEGFQTVQAANLQGKDRQVLTFLKSERGFYFYINGDSAKGEQFLREAIAEYHAFPGSQPWELGASLLTLGDLLLRQQRLDEAEKALLEGEQVLRSTLGDKGLYLKDTLYCEAQVHYFRKDYQKAVDKMRESLAVAQNSFPDDRITWTLALKGLGINLNKLGRMREAETYLRQAITILQAPTPVKPAILIQAKVGLGESLMLENRLADAERITSEAYEESKRLLGDQNATTKSAASSLADIYEKEGKNELAKQLR